MTPKATIHFAFSPSKTAKHGIRFKPKASLGGIIARLNNMCLDINQVLQNLYLPRISI